MTGSTVLTLLEIAGLSAMFAANTALLWRARRAFARLFGPSSGGGPDRPTPELVILGRRAGKAAARTDRLPLAA